MTILKLRTLTRAIYKNKINGSEKPSRDLSFSFLGGEHLTVIYVREGRSKGYLCIGAEENGERYSFTVREAEYREAGSPLVRDNLTREAFYTLQYADKRYNAKLKALRILSYGDNSKLMLARKLLSAGFSKEITDETVSECVRLGYINSKRQLQKLITGEVNIKNHGMAKIIPKLISKGYRRSEIESVADMLCGAGEINFEEAKARIISRLPCGAGDEEIKKALYKNGHTVY